MEALLRLSYSSLKVVNRQADQESMLPCIPSKLFVAAFLAFLSFAGMRMREFLFRATVSLAKPTAQQQNRAHAQHAGPWLSLQT